LINDSELQNIKAYRARWLLPMSAPPIENGIIVCDSEKILAIGAYEDFRDDIPETLIDLEDAVIFPAFVNVHTHLEQEPFSEPIQRYYSYLNQSDADWQSRSVEQRTEIISRNIEESNRFGTIALGDFSSDGLSAELLKDEHVFARVFHETKGFKNFESAGIFRTMQEQIARIAPMNRITNHLGMSSPWELSPDLFKNISIHERHIAIHMSMTEDEIEFLISGKGPARQYLLSKNDFDYSWNPPRITPVQYFFSNRYYARHNILIHMNRLSDMDIDLIKNTPAKVNVCICPRSSITLDLTPTPVKRILDKGVNICMGTESKTLSGDLDMRKDIIECINQSGVNTETALKFATLNGAYAIGFHKEVGSLDVGKTSHCLMIQAHNGGQNDPFAAIMDLTQEVHWIEDYKTVNP